MGASPVENMTDTGDSGVSEQNWPLSQVQPFLNGLFWELRMSVAPQLAQKKHGRRRDSKEEVGPSRPLQPCSSAIYSALARIAVPTVHACVSARRTSLPVCAPVGRPLDTTSHKPVARIPLHPRSEGNEYFKVGDYPRAVASYSEAIALQPTNAVLYSNRRWVAPLPAVGSGTL